MDSRSMKLHSKIKSKKNPKNDPQYTIPTTFGLALEGLYPLPFLMQPRVYPLCWWGVSTDSYKTILSHSLAQTLMVFFKHP
jgi:hypothetical protein